MTCFARFAMTALVGLSLTACVKDRPAPAASDAGVAAGDAAKPPRYDEVPRPISDTVTSVSGKVLEILKVPTYTYMFLETDKEKVWAAVPLAEVKVGDTVTVERAVLMGKYRSSILDREFDRVYFGTLQGAPAAANAANAANPHAALAAPAVSGIKADKATGPDAKTVDEVMSNGPALAGKSVTVRGVVVKVNTRILGKTWIHLQDGSGSADKKTNDLLVTTTSELALKNGDTIVIHGKVSTNKDFGSGYNYATLVEDATLESTPAK